MNWLHLSQTSSVRNTSDGGADSKESRVGASRGNLGQDLRCFGCLLQTQKEHSLECPRPGPPTWAAVISMYGFWGLADDYVTTKLHLQSTKYKKIHRDRRERERERERALSGTTVHNGGSKAAPAARTPHHHALSCFPAYNGGVASYMAKTFPRL
jgi:hypothetical protein